MDGMGNKGTQYLIQKKSLIKYCVPLFLLSIVYSLSSQAFAVADTYHQNFETMEDGVTVNNKDSWIVSAGSPDNALIDSGALKLTGALTPVNVSRPASYGNLSPTWVEYVVKSSMGADQREIPTDGIAAINFSPTGKIMVSDGASWMDTGKTFALNSWYRILLKLDFSTHMYDFYCESVSTPLSPFIPQKQNLHFIDPTIGAMSQVGFVGAYNLESQADAWMNEVVVHYLDKLQFTTSPSTLVKGYATGPITVQLQSATSEAQTAWKDIELELHASTQTGEFSLDANNWVPVSSLILPEGSQQVSFYFKDFTEGRPTISANEFPERGWTDATQEQKVVAEGDFFVVSAVTPQTAGLPFTLQITAMDGAGGVDTTYGGGVDVFIQYVQPLTGSGVLTPNEGIDFAGGLKYMTVTYPDAGTVKVVVRDKNDFLKVGYSANILFMPSSFDVSANPIQIVGKNFPVTIKALEKGGQIAKNYQGPAKTQAVPIVPAATSGTFNPSVLPAGSFENGIATLNTSFNRWGTVGFKVMDEANPEKLGTSAPIQFVPKSLSMTVKPSSSTRNFFYTGESMEISLSVLNQDDFPIENFQGTMSLTPTPSFSIPSQYTFTDADKGQKKFIVPAGTAGKIQGQGQGYAERS